MRLLETPISPRLTASFDRRAVIPRWRREVRVSNNTRIEDPEFALPRELVRRRAEMEARRFWRLTEYGQSRNPAKIQARKAEIAADIDQVLGYFDGLGVFRASLFNQRIGSILHDFARKTNFQGGDFSFGKTPEKLKLRQRKLIDSIVRADARNVPDWRINFAERFDSWAALYFGTVFLQKLGGKGMINNGTGRLAINTLQNFMSDLQIALRGERPPMPYAVVRRLKSWEDEVREARLADPELPGFRYAPDNVHPRRLKRIYARQPDPGEPPLQQHRRHR